MGLCWEAFLTGGFHEDAVADCCDGFGGGWTREDVLRIMKDSRVGSFGALGLTLALLWRGTATASIEINMLIPVTMAAGGLGRWASVLLMATVPPVGDRAGLSRDVGERVGMGGLLVATVWAGLTCAWVGVCEPVELAIGVVAIVATAALWGWYVFRKIGGVTGDCLGFACYAAQLVVLSAAAVNVH